MNVAVHITGLLQRVDLEAGTVSNMLELELSDGTRITAPISEHEAEHVLHLSVGAPPVQRTPVYTEPQASEGDDVHVFGGQQEVQEETLSSPADLQALAQRAAQRTASSVSVPVRQSTYTTKAGVTTMVRTVAGTDEMGNPIIHGAPSMPDGVDESGVDEDGVASA